MPSFDFIKEVEVDQTFRVAKVQGMFDIPTKQKQTLKWKGEIPIENFNWNIGAIVGHSGTGKTVLSKELWPNNYVTDFKWSSSSILDDFDKKYTPKEITSLLSAVGLSSPPVWIRPYKVLSNGQQFRANIARALSLNKNLVVYDEFTSVVDRDVAKVASHAVQKYIRKKNQKFIAVSCHFDFLDWLEIDWLFNINDGSFSRRRLRRPKVKIEIYEGLLKAWKMFHLYHYLTSSIHRSARVFLCFISWEKSKKNLVGFFSILPSVGHKGWWRGHRTAVLPDYQGLGIGNKMIEITAEHLWKSEKKRFRETTSSPSLVYHRIKRPHMWRCAQSSSMQSPIHKSSKIVGLKSSSGRLTTRWEYIPEEFRKEK